MEGLTFPLFPVPVGESQVQKFATLLDRMADAPARRILASVERKEQRELQAEEETLP